VLIHDAGLLRWDANGILTIEADRTRALTATTAAIAAMYAALT
jgi:hypothetical protein